MLPARCSDVGAVTLGPTKVGIILGVAEVKVHYSTGTKTTCLEQNHYQRWRPPL